MKRNSECNIHCEEDAELLKEEKKLYTSFPDIETTFNRVLSTVMK